MRHISLLRPKFTLLLSLNTYSQQLASVQQQNPTDFYLELKQEMTLKSLLLMYENKYQVSIVFSSKAIGDQLVTINKSQDEALEKSLSKVLKPLSLQYKKIDEHVYVIQESEPKKEELEKVETGKLMAQALSTPLTLLDQQPNKLDIKSILEQTISGKVTDGENGDPLPGVNVLARGTTVGTVTDIDGSYRLTVGDEVEVLVYSSIGYEPQQVQINGRNTINITMMPDIQSLNEVVVVGYGSQKKSDVTGSVSSVETE
jgi:TonB-dependent starch-binding outer membrane protein SusC